MQLVLTAQFLLLLASVKASAVGFSADSITFKQVWLASHILPGSGQLLNKQYWKAPVLYAGMGTLTYLAINAHQDYSQFHSDYQSFSAQPYYSPQEMEMFRERFVAKRVERNLYLAGIYAFYVTSIADALIVKSSTKHSPTTATVLSAMLPGLGQVYNRKQWKVPAIYGGFAGIYYMFDTYHRGFTQYRVAYQYQTDNNPDTFNDISIARSSSDVLYFMNAYRRNRDLMVIIMTGFYLLNIIDANVDAHFFDWDISDDLSYRFEPHIDRTIATLNAPSRPTMGLRFHYTF